MKGRTVQPMRLVQINLHHSKAATANLTLLLLKEGVDVALIQEPWILGDQVRGLGLKEYNVLYNQEAGKPRSCIVVKKNINVLMLSNFSSRDLTVIRLEGGQQQCWMASAYMPYDDPSQPPPVEVQRMVAAAEQERIALLLGCDANAHHTVWGSTNINARGESLFNYLLGTNLIVCNRGREPTFINVNRREVLDLTLITQSDCFTVTDWRVSAQPSMSDHCWILFNLNLVLGNQETFRNIRRTDWNIFCEAVEARLDISTPDTLQTEMAVDHAVEHVTRVLNEAFRAACPVSRTKRKSRPPWWNSELGKLREATRRQFNVAKGSRDQADWSGYKDSVRSFKKAIRLAKRTSWRKFCESIESTTEASRLRKIMSKGTTVPSDVRRNDGTWTSTSEELLENLLDTHFPGCSGVEENTTSPRVQPAVDGNWDLISSIVNRRKTKWAIRSCSPYKSAGLDGIRPIMLQKTLRHIAPWLVSIYRSCLWLGYVPIAWREVRVIFIPKAGKASHSAAKDYRPISLSSFMLKILERLLDIHIRGVVRDVGLSRAQHAYTKGRSVETALHTVVSIIEGSMKFGEYTLGAFLDIEGAFNNVKTEAIYDRLRGLGIDTGLCDWIKSMLRTRIVNSSICEFNTRKRVMRGTPQGGVLSPLLWLVVVDEILGKLEKDGFKVIAYADDIVVLVPGKFISTVSERLELALQRLERWSHKNGLGVNPSKTKLVLFTRKRAIPDFRPPTLGGRSLSLSNEARYLGIILDSKLNWRSNIEERARKASVALYACKRMVGVRWGLGPKVVHWLYTAIVRPILTYGVLVWWTAMEKNCYFNKLTRIQRAACVSITGAISSTPTAALEVMLHLLPLDLYCRSQAAISAVRLKEAGWWKGRQVGHATIIQETGDIRYNRSTDYQVPTLDFSRNFEIKVPSREEWERQDVIGEGETAIYTDGSKMSEGTGAGVYSSYWGFSESYRLPDECSVFQAELTAVFQAALLVAVSDESNKDITIYTDSQAAIKALESPVTNSKLVQLCKDKLKEISGRHRVILCWVPGHRDIPGNERADELARRGSMLDASEAMTFVGIPLGTLKRGIVKLATNKGEQRWNNLSTCRTARLMWAGYHHGRTKLLLSGSRTETKNLVSVLTGHWTIGDHARRLGLSANDFCRSCNEAEEAETVRHLLCDCPALSKRRGRFLGSYFFSDLGELQNVELKDLSGFLKASGWFT